MLKTSNAEYKIEQLKKQNRILKRKLGSALADLKVDIKQLRNDSFREGYLTAEKQMALQFELMDNRIRMLESELDEYQKHKEKCPFA